MRHRRSTPEPSRPGTWRAGEALRPVRTSYGHPAGRPGMALAESLQAAGDVTLTADGGEVTATGPIFLHDFSAAPAPGKRVFRRSCVDRSERRPSVAGRLDAALAARYLDAGWIERQRDARAVTITSAGANGFAKRLRIRRW